MTHCICDLPLYLARAHFLIIPMMGNELHPMTWFEIPLPQLWKTHGFIFHMNIPLSFPFFPLVFLFDTLPSSLLDSNVNPKWTQWNNDELGHTPWFVTLRG
jgi:hypothetical protein